MNCLFGAREKQFPIFEKIAHLLLVRAVELTFAQFHRALHFALPKHLQHVVSQQLHVDEWQREILLVDKVKHVEPFRAEHSTLLAFVEQPIKQFLEVQEVLLGHCNCQGFTPVFDGIGRRRGAFRMRSPSACEHVANAAVWDATFALEEGCNRMSNI